MSEIVAPGDRLGGRYVLERPLGTGGMATVWRAADTVLDRPVAVKVPKEGRPGEFTRRLGREAKAAASLAHPGVTAVYDYGEHWGVPYVVMELLDGESLAAHLAGGPLPWREAARIAAHVADALAAAHAAGIVHRDVKPGNVFLTPLGVKVLDFGIAFTGPSGSGGPVLGTPAYVAPELPAGAPPTPAADLYSLGVVLRECLSGSPRGALPDDVPAEVADLCRACLDASPEPRPSARRAARILAAAAGVDLASRRAAPAAPGGPGGEPPQTRVLDGPPGGPAPGAGRRPLLVAGAVAGALALGAALLTVLAPGSPRDEAAPETSAPERPAPPPGGGAAACSVSYRVDGTWPQGFQATVRITNLGDGPIDGWRLVFELPEGQSVTRLWNGSRIQDGSSVTVTAAEWNRSIPPRGTAEFGFLGSGDGAGAAPSRFVLNGGECAA